MNRDGNRRRTSSRVSAAVTAKQQPHSDTDLAWIWWGHYLHPAEWVKFIPQESQFAEPFGFIPVQYLRDYHQQEEGKQTTSGNGKLNARDVSKFVMKHGKRRQHYAIGWQDLHFMVKKYGMFDNGRPPMLLDYKGPSLWQHETAASCEAESAAPKQARQCSLEGNVAAKANNNKRAESVDANKNAPPPKKKRRSKKQRERKKKGKTREKDTKEKKRDKTTTPKGPPRPTLSHLLFAPKYSAGTSVSKRFGYLGWFNGEIVSINEKDRMYRVRYEDGDEEDYYFELPEIHKLVENGKTWKKLAVQQKQPPQQQEKKKGPQHEEQQQLNVEEEEGEIQEQQRQPPEEANDEGQLIDNEDVGEGDIQEEEEGEVQEQQQQEEENVEVQLIDDEEDDESSFDEEALQAEANAALMAGAMEDFPKSTSTTTSPEAEMEGSSAAKRKERPVNRDADTEVMQPRRKKIPMSKSLGYSVPHGNIDVRSGGQRNDDRGSDKTTPTPIGKLTIEFSVKEFGLLCKELQATENKNDPEQQVQQQRQQQEKSCTKQPNEQAKQPEEETVEDENCEVGSNPCNQNRHGQKSIPPPPPPRQSIPQPPPPPQYHFHNDQYYFNHNQYQFRRHQYQIPPPPPPPYYNPFGNPYYSSQPQPYHHPYPSYPNR